MKLFKLIKSIDYVSYPVYKELLKISDTITNSLNSFRDLLISTIVGVLFEKTPISGCILSSIAHKFPETGIGKYAVSDNAPIVLSFLIALMVFGVFKLYCAIQARWGSNKDTKAKRDILVHEFYNVAIPQLIEVKSMYEQIFEISANDTRKKLLLLLQAKYEVCNLHRRLRDMNIIEIDKTGVQTDESNIVSSRISKCTYINFLEEMLDLLYDIYKELSLICDCPSQPDIQEIYTTINSSGIFDKVPELHTKRDYIKYQIQQASKRPNALN